MKTRKIYDRSSCQMHFVICGLGFLGGVLSLVSMAMVSGGPGRPMWFVALLAVVWAVALAVTVWVGVIRCRRAGRTGGIPPGA
jgi:Ni/Fe-hydrogenase subunit HybB-like protein